MDIPSEESVKSVIGHEFPGGEYLIAHWENFLLTECTGAGALPDGLAHPFSPGKVFGGTPGDSGRLFVAVSPGR